MTSTRLNLSEGQTCFFSVRAVLGETPGEAASSDGITVDLTAPQSWVQALPDESALEVFAVSWVGQDALSGIGLYDIQVRTGGGPWTDWLTDTALTTSNFAGTNGQTYSFRSRVRDLAGNLEAYPMAADAQTTVRLPLPPDVAWVHDGLEEDVDWWTDATGLSANWAAVAGADAYQYAVGTTPGGTDVVGWATTGSQTTLTLDDLSLTEGQVYYVSVRAIVDGGPGSATSSDGTTVDTGSPTSSVEPLPAVSAPSFAVSWSGHDAVSGIQYYDIQVTEDGRRWNDWLAQTTLTTATYPGEDGRTYAFRSRARDQAGNWEEYPETADAQTTTGPPPPMVAWVQDGPGDDLDWTNSTTTLEANWAATPEADGFEYAIGTSPGASDLIDWTGVGTQTSMSRSDLLLNAGWSYYVSVRATAGEVYGEATSSDGITVDANAPSSYVEALPEQASATDFTVSWTGTDHLSGISHYDVQVKIGNGDWGDWLTGTALTSAEYAGTIDHAYSFRCRAWDLAGNVESYPTDPDAGTIVTCNYSYVSQWGESGHDPGQFDYPNGLALDLDSNVYVTEANNHRVQKFDQDGNFLATWGSFGNGDGEFNFPAGIAVDDSGNVYVADIGNHRVQKFSPTGTFLRTWGSFGTEEGQFRWPRGVAVDEAHYVWVADSGNDRIQKFTSGGVLVDTWGSLGGNPGEMSSRKELPSLLQESSTWPTSTTIACRHSPPTECSCRPGGSSDRSMGCSTRPNTWLETRPGTSTSRSSGVAASRSSRRTACFLPSGAPRARGTGSSRIPWGSGSIRTGLCTSWTRATIGCRSSGPRAPDPPSGAGRPRVRASSTNGSTGPVKPCALARSTGRASASCSAILERLESVSTPRAARAASSPCCACPPKMKPRRTATPDATLSPLERFPWHPGA